MNARRRAFSTLALLGVTLVALALALTSSARAETTSTGLSLRWNAPEACPDDAELLRAVEGYLGQPLPKARQQPLSISINVLGSAGGFSAKLRFNGPNGLDERDLDHPDCQKLAEAAALLAALAIDPERVNARQQAVETSAAPAPVEPAAAPLPPAAAAPSPLPLEPARVEAVRDEPAASPARNAATSKAVQLRLGAFGFAGGGALPSAGPGLGAEASVRRGHFEIGVVGRYWLPRVEPVAQVPNASIELSLVTVGARACGLPWLGDWLLRGCVGAEAADLWGLGDGVENARTRHALFPALSSSLSLAYGQHRFAPFAGLEASWFPSRPPFGLRVNGENYEVFRPGALNATALLGLVYRL